VRVNFARKDQIEMTNRKGATNVKAQSIAEICLETPLGTVHIAASERGICAVEVGRNRKESSKGSAAARQLARRAAEQVREYFAGKRRDFDLPLDLEGTEQQKRVWQGLLRIPFGKTLSYGALASQLGIPKAARAVGAACGANPVWLVVPCHRVIGADGGLHGYGGGLWRKKALLELEGALPVNSRNGQGALAFAKP
jgi:methylated-DNA-[protein]-cysteine S-methyltransferase